MGTKSQAISDWLCGGFLLCHTHYLNLGEDPENVWSITDLLYPAKFGLIFLHGPV